MGNQMNMLINDKSIKFPHENMNLKNAGFGVMWILNDCFEHIL